jgi:hypothetical protein
MIAKLAIAALSGFLSLLLGLFALEAYLAAAGGLIDSTHMAEPRPRMWQVDPIVGYRNRPNLDLRRVSKRSRVSEYPAKRIGISSCVFRTTDTRCSDKWPSDEAHQPRPGLHAVRLLGWVG